MIGARLVASTGEELAQPAEGKTSPAALRGRLRRQAPSRVTDRGQDERVADGPQRRGPPAASRCERRRLLQRHLPSWAVHPGLGGQIRPARLRWLADQCQLSCLLYTSPSPRDGLLYRM